jgi:hypothetical protein
MLGNVLGWGLIAGMGIMLALAVVAWPISRRRRFWCSLTRLDLEVQFAERGVPGLRRQCAVLSCSVFDPPTAIACRRRCLDSQSRRQWDSALPVHTGRPR